MRPLFGLLCTGLLVASLFMVWADNWQGAYCSLLFSYLIEYLLNKFDKRNSYIGL